MIAQFPNVATLGAALRSGTIPAPRWRSPVDACHADDGSILVLAPGLAVRASATLAAFGVRTQTMIPEGNWQHYSCWAALVPPVEERVVDPPAVALIRTRDAASFLRLVATLRRLHCVGVSFATWDNALWLRIAQPPTWLLHACWGSAELTMYAEQSPNVWCVVGRRHPLADFIHTTAKRAAFIDTIGPWAYRVLPTFAPVEAKQPLELLANTVLASHTHYARFAAPSKLAPTAHTPPASFWVLRDEPERTLAEFVYDADARIIDDLDVALAPDGAGVARIVLRARRSRSGPPALANLGLAYAPFMKFTNVFVPVGCTLMPPLRRDAVRDWLALPNRIVWLAPAVGGFTVESLPQDGFRPLTEWTEYTHPAHQKRTVHRANVSFFDLELYTTTEEAKEKKAKEQRDKKPVLFEETTASELPNVVRGKAPVKPRELTPLAALSDEPIPLSEAVQQLRALEDEFLALTGPVDDPIRQSLWPRIAVLATHAGQDDDAGLGYSNALWEHEAPETISRWFRDEQRQAVNLPAILQQAEPRLSELRAIAAWVVHATVQPTTATALRPHLNRVGQLLEKHDFRLPVRIAWLAWVAFAKLSNADVLALTRARDRLLSDLLEHGLRRDRDLPAFLRSGAARHSLQQSVDLDRFLKLAEYASGWCSGRSMDLKRAGDAVERAYVNLIFAFALAKFGDAEGARLLLHDVGTPGDPGRAYRNGTKNVSEGQEWIWNAYRERVERLLNGESANAPLSNERRRELGSLTGSNRTIAEQFLQFSRIIEPFERVDPYRNQRNNTSSSLQGRLAELTATPHTRKKREKVAEQLEQDCRSLLKDYHDPAMVEMILHAAVPLSVRIGENFALDALKRVVPTVQARRYIGDVAELGRRVELLEASIGVAAHYGRQALIPPILDALEQFIRGLDGDKPAWAIGAMNANSIRFLCRLGLADVAKKLLACMTTALTGDVPLPKYFANTRRNYGIIYPALLRLSGGWFYFNNDEPAQLTLRKVREELLLASASHEPRSKLAAAYVLAQGHAPVKQALAAFFDLFEKLPVPTIMDMNMPLYTIQRLRVVEAVAVAMGAEDFAVDGNTRKWLDDDEYMIRRRVHRDVATAMHAAGL